MFSETLVYIAAVTLFAGFLQTVTGFGYALAATPLLVLVMNPKDAVMFVLFSGVLVKLVMLWRTRHIGRLADIGILVVAGVAGALPGAIVMTYINTDLLKILIGIILLVVTFLMYRQVRWNMNNKKAAQTAAGMISGFLASTTSFNGPPLVLYFMNEGTPKEVIRANMARYFVLGNGASLIMGWFFGTLQVNTVAISLAFCIPALLAGFWLGEKVFPRIEEELFRKLALGVVSVSGLVTVATGLWRLVH